MYIGMYNFSAVHMLLDMYSPKLTSPRWAAVKNKGIKKADAVSKDVM